VRFGDGRELARLASDLTKAPVDLLFAVARPATVTVHTATSTIPVVAIDLESDPVASGFVVPQGDRPDAGAQILNLTLHAVEARTTAQIEPAFRDAMRERPSGMIVLTSPILNSGRRTIVELAARHRLPTLMPFPGDAHDGGLIAYGRDSALARGARGRPHRLA
jgi:putative tryptophan/tyrosine transport system substrate-binding protein